MKKAIVTGSSGFVGSALVENLLNNGYEVIGLDAVEKKFGNNFTFIKFDLSKINELETEQILDADVFFHLAWAGGTAMESRKDIVLQLNNAQWTIELLTLSKKIQCKKFIVAGTIVEGETIAATYTQGNKPGLQYIYGAGKVVAHTMAMSVAADIGIDLIWASITNAYGVGENSTRMINTSIRKAIDGVSPQFTSGTQNYDFVYITDVAEAFRLIGEKGKPFNEYRIGSGQPRPLKEFLLEMKNIIAPNLDFIFGGIPFTGVDLPLEYWDTSQTEKDTGFKPKIPFAEGVKLTMNWLKEQTK
jgi:nucleoside-diphosphate-sugar epimerase